MLEPNKLSGQVFKVSFFAISAILFCLAFLLNGTGGGGDSILHFQYARYAWQHPENFFNHWAKPVFTILAFPFAQFGFTGIKVFNVLLSLIACWFTYKTLQIMLVKNRHWIALILFSITLFVNVTLSGLTEPLSAAMIMLSIYLVLANKEKAGVTVISFLPFVRSEGLVIMGVFFIYLLVSKKYKTIPFLAIGHVVLSIIGSFFYHDLLWVFNKIPYAHLSSVYGTGTWMHFVNQLYFQLGLPIYILLWVGGISLLFGLLNYKKQNTFFNEKLWLIYGCFVTFFIAHTAFWALGIFNSMGLVRVFVTVMPLVAIIALDGLNFLTNYVVKFNAKISRILLYLFLAAILVFPFLNNPASYKIPHDFVLEPAQQLIKNQLVPYIQKQQPNKTLVLADFTIPFFLNIDPFDKQKLKIFYEKTDFNTLTDNEIIVWDSWFSVVENNISLEALEQNNSLKKEAVFSLTNESGTRAAYVVFSKK